MKSIVILISGRGSNMQAILEARLPLTVAAVISNDPEAGGLATAQKHGIAPAGVTAKDIVLSIIARITTAPHSTRPSAGKSIPSTRTSSCSRVLCEFLPTPS